MFMFLFCPAKNKCLPHIDGHGLEQWKVIAGGWRVGGKSLKAFILVPMLPDRNNCAPPS